MKNFITKTLVALSSVCLAASVLGQTQAKEIRVLLANHPYGELLKTAIPEFEQATGIKVNVESLQESQLTTKLTTEFATELVLGGRLHDAAAAGRKDVLQERLVRAASRLRLLRLPEERHERGDLRERRPTSCRSSPSGRSSTTARTSSEGRGQGAHHVRGAGSRGEEAQHRDGVAGFASRGKGAAAVTQMSSYVYNYGGLYLDKGTAVFDSKPAIDAIRFYGKMLGNYGPQGVTSMSWENIMPLFQAGKVAMWTDASVFYGQIVDPAKIADPRGQRGHRHVPGRAEDRTRRTSWCPGAWPWPRSPRTRTSRMKFLDLGDEQGPGEAGNARQHHHGALLGLGGRGRPRQDEPGPGRHPGVRREERLSASTGRT